MIWRQLKRITKKPYLQRKFTSLCMKKPWLVSWQHTFIWRLEILTKPCITFYLHMKSTKNGEHSGNAIVCSILLNVLFLQHLPTLPTLALVLAIQILLVVATATRNGKNLKMLNGIGISL
ncbi:hypothetical protein ACHAXM_000066, partial [Skeletonema potamos]